MVKRKVLALAIAVFLLLASVALAGEFWGSAKSDVYHYPDCRYTKKIDPLYLVKFSSVEEAQDAGYRPCKVCKPPRFSAPLDR